MNDNKKYTVINEFGCASCGDVFERVEGTDMWRMHKQEGDSFSEMFLGGDVMDGLIANQYLIVQEEPCCECCRLDKVREFVEEKIAQYEQDHKDMLEAYNNQEIPTCVKVEAETVYYNMTKVLNKVKEIINE